jgi:hypothetical protein
MISERIKLLHMGFTNSLYMSRMLMLSRKMLTVETVFVVDGPDDTSQIDSPKSPRLRFKSIAMPSNQHTEVGNQSTLKKEMRTLLVILKHLFEVLINILWWKQMFSGNTIIHCHSLFLSHHLAAILLFSKKCRLILSPWGSDINRDQGIVMLIYQKLLMSKAKRITLSGSEAAAVLYAKFGHEYASRVVQAFYPPNLSVLDALSRKKTSSEAKQIVTWKQKHGLELSKITLVIGHNGHVFNQHLAVLDYLCKMNQDFLSRIQLIIPLTYGASDGYKLAVIEKAQKLSIPLYIPTTLLSECDLLILRSITDIFVHVPEEDAYSAAVTEALAAGTAVIAGAWLPYGDRRRKGYYFEDVHCLDELPATIEKVALSLALIKSKLENNQKITKQLYNIQRLAESWECCYN